MNLSYISSYVFTKPCPCPQKYIWNIQNKENKFTVIMVGCARILSTYSNFCNITATRAIRASDRGAPKGYIESIEHLATLASCKNKQKSEKWAIKEIGFATESKER
jgi:hypothetical protein